MIDGRVLAEDELWSLPDGMKVWLQVREDAIERGHPWFSQCAIIINHTLKTLGGEHYIAHYLPNGHHSYNYAVRTGWRVWNHTFNVNDDEYYDGWLTDDR